MSSIDSVLANSPLFGTLPRKERSRLAQSLTVKEFPAETVLFREGDSANHFSIVLDGNVEIVKASGTSEESILGVRGEGEFIGEMGLLNQDGLRTAAARTKEATRCLEIPFNEFTALLSRYPTLAYRMANVLSQRMTAAQDDVILTLSEKNHRLEQAYEELKAAQIQLVEKEKLERELQLAGEIQQSILPIELPKLAGYEFGALMEPARAVGGDFFSVFPLSASRMAIVVGDVMGKGIPAAIFMAQTHALLRALADETVTPGETLRRVNRLLMRMNDKGLFVTAVYGILHGPSGVFDYARAGHELPLLMSTNGDARFLPKGEGMPLGILDDAEFEESTLTLAQRELLLLYSDGVPDGCNATGNRFDHAGLIVTARTVLNLGAQQICSSIVKAVSDFQQGAPQFDDITLIALRRADA